ncbi:SDR family oxidoreductase [Micromonospora sp. BQ11]|uniref:SDR family oxidoreductase n=1 Tax=Micromonospora sp. BQ11 TaxID=3452212 RepID=UPI003F8CB0FA
MSDRHGTIEKVLVYGATGQQARPVAARLLEAGFTVRVASRTPARAADLADLGAEVVAADFSDPTSLRAASEGMDGVFLLVPFFDPQARYGREAVNAARNAGVRLVVWNPTGAIPPQRTGNAGLDVRRDIHEHLKGSGVPHIVLQPTAYMENFLGPWTAPEVAAADTFAYPTPLEVVMQWVSHDDVAAYVVAAFRRPDLAGRVFDVGGPEALNGEEVAARFSAALGRRITFRPMPPKEFGAYFEAMGGPGAGDDVTAAYEAVYENPTMLSTRVDLAVTLSELSITPTSLREWVGRHAPAFTRPV